MEIPGKKSRSSRGNKWCLIALMCPFQKAHMENGSKCSFIKVPPPISILEQEKKWLNHLRTIFPTLTFVNFAFADASFTEWREEKVINHLGSMLLMMIMSKGLSQKINGRLEQYSSSFSQNKSLMTLKDLLYNLWR